MALVKEYCKLNQALISVESVKDEGSTFTVLFPQDLINKEIYFTKSKVANY